MKWSKKNVKLILYGISEHVAQVWRVAGPFKYTEFFISVDINIMPYTNHITANTCAPIFELPSNISTKTAITTG